MRPGAVSEHLNDPVAEASSQFFQRPPDDAKQVVDLGLEVGVVAVGGAEAFAEEGEAVFLDVETGVPILVGRPLRRGRRILDRLCHRAAFPDPSRFPEPLRRRRGARRGDGGGGCRGAGLRIGQVPLAGVPEELGEWVGPEAAKVGGGDRKGALPVEKDDRDLS